MSCGMEQTVFKFASRHIAEPVFVQLRPDMVMVRHRTRVGSVQLAGLWIRMLQHSYPPGFDEFRRQYDTRGQWNLVLQVDGMTLNVNTQNGTLTIKGAGAHKWFQTTFASIMAAYSVVDDNPTLLHGGVGNAQPHAEFNHTKKHWSAIYTASQSTEDKMYKDNVTKDPHMVPSSATIDTDRESIEPLEAYGHFGEVLHEAYRRQQISQLKDMWLGEELDEVTVRIQHGGVMDGTQAYTLWVSLLHDWLSRAHSKLYIMTAQLDERCLTEICKSVLRNVHTAQIVAIRILYKTGNLVQQVSRHFSSSEQLILEYRVFGNILYEDTSKTITPNFVAYVCGSETTVFSSSGSFDSSQYHSGAHHFVIVTQMPNSDFKRLYLGIS